MSLLLVMGVGTWEGYWRSQQFVPSYRGSDGLWAILRRQVDRPGPATVAIGASRTLSDLHLEAWREETGLRPIQLALEGTNPRPIMRDLAQIGFSGLLIVGVTPVLFTLPDTGYRAGAVRRYAEESPSQWLGQQISMPLERLLAFYTFDTSLFAVIKRQTWWPERDGYHSPPRDVRKLFNYRRTRQADLWTKLDDDPTYAALAQDIWRDFLYLEPDLPPEEELRRQFETMLEEVGTDVEAIRAAGGEVVFVRMPSNDEFREVENKVFPRERVWQPIVDAADAVGVHFEDYPQLQGMTLPEWSHMSSRDTDGFTRALVSIIRNELAARGVERQELTP
jgi:hypothetical protein